MKFFKVPAFFLILVISTAPNQAQWKKLNHDLPNWIIGDAISVYNDNIFLSVRQELPNRMPYLSKDAGKTWIQVQIPEASTYDNPVDLEIVNENLLVAVFHNKYSVSLDGGINWQNYFVDSTQTNFLNFVEFFDDQNGIIMGDARNNSSPTPFYKTTDGGITWQTIESELTGAVSGDRWLRLDFIDNDLGFFRVSGNEIVQGLYKTSDGAQSWELINDNTPFHSIKFYDENYGIGLTSDKVYRTIDGGISWETAQLSTSGWGNDILFNTDDPSQIWVTNYQSLFESTDSGKTWNNLDLPDTGENGVKGRDFELSENGEIWFLADNEIWYLENNDVTEIEEINTIPEQITLYQNYPNPFNPETNINFYLDKTTYVSLTVWDVLGNKVSVLMDDTRSAGKYSLKFNASKLTSGAYFYKLETPDFTQTKKLLLLK